MHKRMRLLFAGILLCAAMPLLAQDKSADEKKLDKVSMTLDEDAATPEGDKAVMARLMGEFGVDAARIQGLRDQKLGYGEIGITLSLAKGMEGGITDANVQQVMTLRRGPPVMGWGKIAQQLGEKLGPVISRVKKVSADARRDAAAERKMIRKGKPEKGERMAKPERPGRMERMERPERPERSGKR